ncbi:MAG TPA: EVE domain-containing protein [Ignavibacteriaceae bacterium]|nr:EVE domain-containing protein [Ignavibacteriaceae bacterium]
MAKKSWLFKSEPDVFSFNDLQKSKNQTTYWDGVRNF